MGDDILTMAIMGTLNSVSLQYWNYEPSMSTIHSTYRILELSNPLIASLFVKALTYRIRTHPRLKKGLMESIYSHVEIHCNGNWCDGQSNVG